MQNKIEIVHAGLQVEKNGNGFDTNSFFTNEGDVYARTENDGVTWTLLMAENGEHFDSGNKNITNSNLSEIMLYLERIGILAA